MYTGQDCNGHMQGEIDPLDEWRVDFGYDNLGEDNKDRDDSKDDNFDDFDDDYGERLDGDYPYDDNGDNE